MTPLAAHLRPPRDRARAVVVVDGEHYPSAVRDAIDVLVAAGWDVAAAALAGGSEKLRGQPDYGVPHLVGPTPEHALKAAITASGGDIDAVIDLADEPVLTFERRLGLISLVGGLGAAWLGADAGVWPQATGRIGARALAVIGTGKRIGKTAVSAHLARLADRALGSAGSVVVVAMGRGGPAEPVVVDRAGGPVTVERLLEISRAGSHAASDYLEDAALTGLTTIGCRRVGGGLLGAPVVSNVFEGAVRAASMSPALVILEGSGSCVPPVAADSTMLIASTARPRDLFSDLGAYRLARADLLLVMGDDAVTAGEMAARARSLRPELEVVAARLVPTPVGEVRGCRCAVFTTAPDHVLATVRSQVLSAGGEPVLVSGSLAHRERLREEVAQAVADGVDAFVVEIKAAGIDVVAEAAAAENIRVVFLDNPPVAHDPDIDLDARLVAHARAAAGH